jgi:hypothetical protein
MKKQTAIGRRQLFHKLAGSAGAAALAAAIPAATAAFAQDPASSSETATVRVILADGATVQWLAVTSGGLTVGGETTIPSPPTGLNPVILKAAIAAIVAAGGPQIPGENITLLGGRT